MIEFCYVEHQLRIEGFRFEVSDPVDSSKNGGSFRDCTAGDAACRPPIGKACLHLAPDHQLLEGSPKHPCAIALRVFAAARHGTLARSRMGSWDIAAGGRWSKLIESMGRTYPQ